MRKIVVLGIDGLNPQAVARWLDDLPNLRKMQQGGIWGLLESTVPPIAPQAWISSQSGQNPGAYGLWNSTYRDDFTYDESGIVDSRVIDQRADCLHGILPKMGQSVAMINAPGTWPPPEIPGGYCISDAAPDGGKNCSTWPESLEGEIRELVGEHPLHPLDLKPPRSQNDAETVLTRICEMDTQRLSLMKHFAHNKNCDYTLAVLSGPRQIHRLWESRPPNDASDLHHQDALHTYYKWLDRGLEELCHGLGSDTALLLYSPYSLDKICGQINLNEWFVQNGYMTLSAYPEKPTAIEKASVDWSQTKCWSKGESGSIYLNLKGRESQGAIDPDDYDVLLDEVADRLSQIHDQGGNELNGQVFKREDIHSGPYQEYGPDLFLHIDKAPWMTNDRVGYGSNRVSLSVQQEELHGTYHGLCGYFCLSGSDVPSVGELEDLTVLHVAPTIMEALKLEVPIPMEKPSILSVGKTKEKKSPVSRKERVRSRLKALGY
jgi:predicted AlkP superfamily phosphohydrolase/phosphomutase